MNTFASISNSRQVQERSTGHRIAMNDRIYVKLVLHGVTLMETVRDNIADYTSLLALVREAAKRYKGLARMVVRNISRGWSMQRPLLLSPPACERTAMTTGHYPMPWQFH